MEPIARFFFFYSTLQLTVAVALSLSNSNSQTSSHFPLPFNSSLQTLSHFPFNTKHHQQQGKQNDDDEEFEFQHSDADDVTGIDVSALEEEARHAARVYSTFLSRQLTIGEPLLDFFRFPFHSILFYSL